MKGFFERQWDLFLNDMQEIGEFFLDAFGANEKLMLGAPKEVKVDAQPKEGFFKREWDLFKADIEQANSELESLFGIQKKNEVVAEDKELSKNDSNVIFGGRLGSYKYCTPITIQNNVSNIVKIVFDNAFFNVTLPFLFLV